MTSKHLREILAGTGAEVIDGNAPVVFAHPTEFRLLDTEEANEALALEGKEAFCDPPVPSPPLVLRFMMRKLVSNEVEDFRANLGGKKIVNYHVSAQHTADGRTIDDTTSEVRCVRYALWPEDGE